MKAEQKILIILIVFSLIGYALTYPYELSYQGTKDIKILEDIPSVASFSEVIDRPAFHNKVLYLIFWEPFEELYHGKSLALPSEQLKAMQKRYKDQAFEFVYLTRPDSDSRYQEDEMRKWKAAIKAYQFEGNHIYISPLFYQALMNYDPEMHFPNYMIVNKQGDIVNFNASSPEGDQIAYQKAGALLRPQKSKTTRSENIQALYTELDNLLK